MKGKIDIENYEWIMMKPKAEMGNLPVILFVPKNSKVSIQHLTPFKNLAVAKVDDYGVWLKFEEQETYEDLIKEYKGEL